MEGALTILVKQVAEVSAVPTLFLAVGWAIIVENHPW